MYARGEARRGRDSGRDLPQEWIEFGVGNQLWNQLRWTQGLVDLAMIIRNGLRSLCHALPSSFSSLLPGNPCTVETVKVTGSSLPFFVLFRLGRGWSSGVRQRSPLASRLSPLGTSSYILPSRLTALNLCMLP